MAETLTSTERVAVWRKERAKEGVCQVQIYMDKGMRERMDEARKRLGVKNRSEMITRALEAYLERQTV